MPSKRVRTGRPVDDSRRQRILQALSADPANFFEIGTPPYNVALLARVLSVDASNLRKDLLRMEAEGLAVRENRKTSAWNAIAGTTQERVCLCFWNARTVEQDKALVDAWEARREERSDAVWARFGSNAAG